LLGRRKGKKGIPCWNRRGPLTHSPTTAKIISLTTGRKGGGAGRPLRFQKKQAAPTKTSLKEMFLKRNDSVKLILRRALPDTLKGRRREKKRFGKGRRGEKEEICRGRVPPQLMQRTRLRCYQIGPD